MRGKHPEKQFAYEGKKIFEKSDTAELGLWASAPGSAWGLDVWRSASLLDCIPYRDCPPTGTRLSGRDFTLLQQLSCRNSRSYTSGNGVSRV